MKTSSTVTLLHLQTHLRDFPHRAQLIAQRHPLDLLTQRSPVVRLELCILDPFLAPILMQSADMILRLLEEEQLVPDALLDKDAAGMLVNDRLLIL